MKFFDSLKKKEENCFRKKGNGNGISWWNPIGHSVSKIGDQNRK